MKKSVIMPLVIGAALVLIPVLIPKISAIDKLEALAEEEEADYEEEADCCEEETLKKRMDDPRFVRAMEDALRRTADKIDNEVGRPIRGFRVVDSNVDVDGDTYSSTREAEAATVVDLAALRDRILAQRGDWESGDVSLDGDSLDITFEKAYPPVTIDGIELIPEASVTISATTNSPRRGMTSMDYDIDITLEETDSEDEDDNEECCDDEEDDEDDEDEEEEEEENNNN